MTSGHEVIDLSEPSEAPAPAGGHGRAGRNLPVAIAIGLTMGAVVLTSLYTFKPVFLAVVVLAVGYGMWELVHALAAKGFHAPYIPLLLGSTAILCTSYAIGRDAMTDSLLFTLPLIVAWRVVKGTDGLVGDLGVSVLALLYVGFLAGFCGLMLAAHDGDDRVATFVSTVVASDVGGYAAGVLFGKHPLAPRISPKKSWEGLGGSVLLCVAVGAVLCTTLVGAQWWQGVVFGLAVVTSATLGGLGESMVKRDLGIKDMGTLLPGHGGVLDRLDSLLPTAPVAWALLAAFVPVH
ncbi:MAG TPA: phosphatidate cytidylyltransferase [Mycobacteriales bacterium]|nr:phosphatidate cytidylyltransferase [Mycobacteriales bacterium]